jgi:hypothetical protein
MSEQLLTALRQSTREEKWRAFAELANEFLAEGTDTRPIQDAQGRVVGYLTPVNGPAAFIPTDPAWVAEQRRRIRNPGKTYSPEEFLKKLNEAAERQAK